MQGPAYGGRVLAMFCLALSGAGATLTADLSVKVQLKAAVVDADLAVKPVPKQRFQIVTQAETPEEVAVITTSFIGEAEVLLPPGRYRVRSVAPLQFGARILRWNLPFEVKGTEPLLLELSNDNAIVESPPPGTAGRSDSGAQEIFRALRGGVVTIESESAQGTGFVVDPRGLLLTNEHVISGSRYFTVNFDDEHRLPAAVLASDATEDVAVLVINPKAMQAMPVIALAPDTPEQPAVREGDAIYAIGSPLHQQGIITAGIVSKVEQGVIISDVMIDHGNSGGPLINAGSQAVGINTFGEGRGVSGTIRIWKALPVLQSARSKLESFSLPSPEFLPAIPKERFPADAMKQIVLAPTFDLTEYHLATPHFDVYLLTPPALCYFDHQDDIKAAQGRQARRKKVSTADTYDPVSDIKGWGEYVGEYRTMVRILTTPRIKPTVGSSFGAGLLGSSVLHYRFLGDVDTFRLMRRGKEIEPVRRGRVPVSQRFSTGGGHMEDVAYLGFADFLPEAFEPPTTEKDKVSIEIVDEAKAGAVTRLDIGDELLKKIWLDLAPLREGVHRK